MQLQLRAIKKLEGVIELESGLHIGSGNLEMHIGGTDSPVVKHPHTREPYIPGSSLKGKIRALLELASGLVPVAYGLNNKGGGLVTTDVLDKVKDDPNQRRLAEEILKVFGSSGAEDDEKGDIGPTRVSFADCHLDRDWLKKAQDNQWLLTEEKSENRIDRVRGVAEHPRFIERVPAGARFRFKVTFKVLRDGEDALFDGVLLRGMRLLEHDALGASGSRGYGRIRFDQLQLDGVDITEKFAAIAPLG